MRKGIAAVGLGFATLLGLLAATAVAVQEELLEQARKLVVEGKPLIEVANDIELKMEQRSGPRKEAFQKLKQARDLYDKYLDLNPGMVEKLDTEYTDLYSLIYWLKKDSSLGELEKDVAAPDLPQGAGPPADKGEKPATPPDAGPPADKGVVPAPPKSESPSEFAWRAKKQFDAITEFEKKHHADLPLVKQYYERFLSEFSDTSLPEYAKALEQLGKINDRMKTVLKEVAKRDPDTISGADTKEEKAIFGRLTSDFSSKDPEIRRRAAAMMASSRARAAAYFLARGLADKDEELAKICRDGLIAAGGTNVGDNLVKLYRDASKEKQQAAMDVLAEIAKKGKVDAKTQSPWIGHFVLSNVSEIAEFAISVLTKMGKAGGPGLVFGLDSIYVEKKLDIIRALTAVKYYPAAGEFADRYLGNKVPPALRQAAMDGIEQMGPRAVPYCIPFLASAWVPFVMRKVTGDPTIILGDRKKVRAWWDAHKAEYPDEPD